MRLIDCPSGFYCTRNDYANTREPRFRVSEIVNGRIQRHLAGDCERSHDARLIAKLLNAHNGDHHVPDTVPGYPDLPCPKCARPMRESCDIGRLQPGWEHTCVHCSAALIVDTSNPNELVWRLQTDAELARG